jgi:amino acid transporter
MKLKRELGLADVFFITVGSVISAELFILPGIAYAMTGPSVILSYLIAGLIALPSTLSASELVTAMPKEGGIYYYTSRSMGFTAGTLAGFARWFAISIKNVFALLGIGVYATLFMGGSMVSVAVLFALLFIVVNLVGIKAMERVQLFLVIGLMGILMNYIATGIGGIVPGNYSPLFPFGAGHMLSAAGFLFFSYAALLGVTTMAEEVKRPERNIPLGMMLSLVFVAAIYSLTAFVTVGILDPGSLRNNLTPVSDAAELFMGDSGMLLIVIGALLAAITTVNSGITAASRYPMAMSRDGILPESFQKLNGRFRTPHVSILVTGAFIIAVVTLIPLEFLVEVASTLLIMTYVLVNLAVIAMREYRKEGYRPRFRSPLYPWTQLVGTIGLVLLLIGMGTVAIAASGLFIAGSILWYHLYGLPRMKGQKPV